MPDRGTRGAGLLAGLTLAHLALRLALVPGRRGPMNVADEVGYLVNARVLVGDLPATMERAAFYRGGYSLLLVPAAWLGRTPLAEFRWVLVTNAVLSSLVVPVLYLLLRRVFGVRPRTATVAAAVGALYPPLVVTTQMAWTESLLPVLLLGHALAAGLVFERGRAEAWGLGAGLLAGAAWTVHGRSAPVLLVTGAVVLVAVLHARWLPALLALGGLAATVVAGAALNRYLLAASWGGQGSGELDRVLANAQDLGGLASVVALGAGQVWYLLVATFGLGAAGAAVLVRHLVQAIRQRTPTAAGVASACVLAELVGTAVLVGLFLRPAVRADHVVYGRYVEVLAPLLLALGVAEVVHRLARAGRDVLVGLVVAAGALAVVLPYGGGLVSRSPVNWLTVLALLPLLQPPDRIWPATATVAAAVGAAVVLGLSRRSRTLGVAALVAAALLSVVALRVVLIRAPDREVHEVADGPLRAVPGLLQAEVVAYDEAAYDPIGLFVYQWQLDRSAFVLFDSRRAPPPARWVVAAPDWPQAGRYAARRVWVHEQVGQAVWRLP